MRRKRSSLAAICIAATTAIHCNLIRHREFQLKKVMQTQKILLLHSKLIWGQSNWIAHRKVAALTVFASVLASFVTPLHAHESCPYLCSSIAECTSRAEWIVEGTIEEVIDEGSRNTCETGPVAPMCRVIKEPETIKVSNAKVLKGKFQLSPNRIAFIPRKYTCFNGVLSFMNSKPEAEKVGVRIRFFGNNDRSPIYVRPGYYFLEDAVAK